MTKTKHTPQGGRILDYTDYHPADYGKPEGYEITDNVDDLQALVNLSIQSLKKGGAKYPNTCEGFEMLKQGIIGYFEYIRETNERLEDRPVFPDVEGLTMYLRINRQTLLNYEARGGEWAEVIGNAKTNIAAIKKQLGSTFKIPPILQIFDLTNNAGYVNSTEFKLQQETPPDTTTPALDTREISGLLENPELPE